MNYDLTYLSFGAGVQSTALLLMSNLQDHGVPRADVAIFADTGDEPPWVYETVRRAEIWSSIPIRRVQYGTISKDLEGRLNGGDALWYSVPAFSKGGRSILRRQCTREYKITPIYKEIRHLLGLKPRQRFKGRVLSLIGISYDEALRVKTNRVKWIENCHPLVDAKLNREHCKTYLQERGIPVPQKSSCVFCPYHDDFYWAWLKINHPEQFQEACRVEGLVQRLDKLGLNKAFLHRECVPLDQVDFIGRLQTKAQNGFVNECEGVCGV